MEDAESALARNAARGDERALHELIDRHGPRLLAIAQKMVSNPADAEDLVQETFLAGIQGLEKFEQRSSLYTWLVSILGRQVTAWRRRSKIRVTVELPEEAAAHGTSQSDMKMDITAALNTLTPEHRDILILREFARLSYDEIALSLDLPRGTVESRLHRARALLRQRLPGYE